MTPVNPIDYINRIEDMFDKCRKDNLGRMSVEWGAFSHHMNRQLRIDTENARDRKLRSRLNYVFMYWIELSRCLDQKIPDLKLANQMKQQALTDDPLDFEVDINNPQDVLGII